MELSPAGNLRGGGEPPEAVVEQQDRQTPSRGDLYNNVIGKRIASFDIGWILNIDGSVMKQSIVDLNAIYHVFYTYDLKDNEYIEIEAQFPRCRFFSFQVIRTHHDTFR